VEYVAFIVEIGANAFTDFIFERRNTICHLCGVCPTFSYLLTP